MGDALLQSGLELFLCVKVLYIILIQCSVIFKFKSLILLFYLLNIHEFN